MDQNNQPSRLSYQQPAIIQQVINPNFPSIKELFSISWLNFKRNLLSVLVINAVGLACLVLLAIIFVVLITTLSSVNLITALIFNAATVILLSISIIVFLLISNTLFTANLLAINDSKSTAIKALLLYSLRLSPKMLILSLIIAIIVMGGIFLFVIPGIIFGLFLIFAPIIMLLENQSIAFSLKRSIYLVARSFGDVFVRLLILLLIPLLVTLTLTNFFSTEDISGMIVSLLSFLFNLFYSWFALSYLINFYKETKQGTDPQAQARIKPLLLFSIIGIILASAVGTGLYSYASRLNSQFNLATNDVSPIDTGLEDFELLTESTASASPTTTPKSSAKSQATSSAKVNTATTSASPR